MNPAESCSARDWHMVSQRRTIGCSLAVAALLLQSLLGVHGACSFCNAARLWHGRSATEAGDALPNTCRSVVRQIGGSFDGQPCACFCRKLKMHHEILRLQEDLTAWRTPVSQFSKMSTAGSDGWQEPFARHAFSAAGLPSAPQSCALGCRFLL